MAAVSTAPQNTRPGRHRRHGGGEGQAIIHEFGNERALIYRLWTAFGVN